MDWDSVFEQEAKLNHIVDAELRVEVEKNAKFERFNIRPAEQTEAAAPVEDPSVPKGFRRINEDMIEPDEPETEVDKLNRQVQEEKDQEEANLSDMPNG